MGCTASVGIDPNPSLPTKPQPPPDTTLPLNRIFATRDGIEDIDGYTISQPDESTTPDTLSATHMRMIRSISRNRVREIDTVVGGGLLSHKQDIEFSTSGMASARSSRLGISSQYPFLSPSHNPHSGSIDVLTMSHRHKHESANTSAENSIVRPIATPPIDDGNSFRRRRMSDFRSSSRSAAPSPTLMGRGGRILHTVHVSSSQVPVPTTTGNTTPPHGSGSGRNSPHSRRNLSIGSRPPELDLHLQGTSSMTSSPTHQIQITAPTITLNPRRSSMPTSSLSSTLPIDTLGTASLYGSLTSLASSPEFQHATPLQQQHLLQTIHNKEKEQAEISQGYLGSRRTSAVGTTSVTATPRSVIPSQQGTPFPPPSPLNRNTIDSPIPPSGGSPPSQSHTRLRGRGKRTALIVDNVAVSQRLNSVALYRAGYTCEHAQDGESAITMAMETHYDLILIDVLLPGLNGIQVCQQIRAYENRTGEIPSLIVGLTSTVDNISMKSYQLARMNAVIEKGSIISQVIPDLIRTLASNSNFCFVNARHIKSQAPKIDSDIDPRGGADTGLSSIGRQTRLRIDPSTSAPHSHHNSTPSTPTDSPLHSPSNHIPVLSLDGTPMMNALVNVDTIAPAVTDQDQMAALASVTLKRGSNMFPSMLLAS